MAAKGQGTGDGQGRTMLMRVNLQHSANVDEILSFVLHTKGA